jgi:hypothetical protein
MPATVQAEIILKPLEHGTMQAGAQGSFDHGTKDRIGSASGEMGEQALFQKGCEKGREPLPGATLRPHPRG